MNPTGMLVVIPSCLAVGEEFSLKLKLRGELREIPSRNTSCNSVPRLEGPFNLNVQRRIQFMDDCLPEWTGSIEVQAPGLEGPRKLVFDGSAQGTFPGDRRPIREFKGFRWTAPGFHFIKLVDPVSGLEASSNAVLVTPQPPAERIFWGDPHWQTFFSDGIRCPEELYSFARDEAFLDFGAVSDHMEALTPAQWSYFQAVTNAFNAPGRFATLVGQEWTNHDPGNGAPGHRNIYFRGDHGPRIASNDPDCNTLEKLWRRLDARPELVALAIPHHTANDEMGVEWSLGCNPKYEKAVEIYSVWGNSEKSAAQGNPRPIRASRGERPGRHVLDALKRGFRFGFVGGGDIHDGRPGDDLHVRQTQVLGYSENLYPQGFTAARVRRLCREDVFDAIAARRTYATTKRRIYLDVRISSASRERAVSVLAASEDGIREAVLVRNGEDVQRRAPDHDPRIVETGFALADLADNEFCYLRILTGSGDMAWSSPFWVDGK